MQKTSSTHLKQNISILQNALRSDLLITKQNKPFVVVMDYQKYQALSQAGKIANAETMQAIQNLEQDKDVITYNNSQEMFDDLDL
jgi:PHD/YefM family antitoxin component YafN of YafNO toxin-antitoxin module